MSRDWKRLAEAIRHERLRRGLTQIDLANAAGVVEASVQKLERGDGYGRMPSSAYAVGEAFGWVRGSIKDILDGGEPTLEAAALPAPVGDAPEADSFAKGMPLRVATALRNGEIVDTDVVEFGPDGARMEMIVVLRRREGDAPIDPEDMRVGLERWMRAQPQIRRIAHEED